MGEFPAHLFRLEGDPGAIRSSAGKWSEFGTAAAEAAGQITALDTSQFVGPEGDLFREGLNESMPDHLRITGEAFGKVAGALNGFAGTLSGLQERMRPLAARAPGLWETLQQTQGRVADAQNADQSHARETAARPPEQAGAPDPYQSDTGAATTALSGAQRAWQECVDAAGGVRAELGTAVDSCVRVVDEAKEMRFKENPKWYDLGGQFENFVRDNKELLQQLSGALKVVALVAGVLAFVPVIGPAFGVISLAAGAGALLIDASVMAATGEGSLTTLLIDGVLMLPGIGVVGKALRGKSVITGVGRARMQNFGFTNRVIVRSDGNRFTQMLPRGSQVHGGAGGTARNLGDAPPRLDPFRSQHPTAHEGVKVSSSPGQNQLAHRTVERMEASGARDIRVDQAQVSGADKVGTNRPDVQGSVGDQRVNVEYDRPLPDGSPGARVEGHVDNILTNDPNSIVITVPKG
ncbi:MAG: putative T7SS-secreted protein [Pseudonocardiaceae bacterium]